jgi:HYR domain/Bacterial TSP3 repeat
MAPCQNDAGACVNYAPPTATSPQGGLVNVTCAPPPGWFPIGITTVTCTATDCLGQTTTCTFTVTVTGHGPAKWEWARQGTGTGADSGKAVAVDAWGNVFVTGSFSRTMTLQGGNSTIALTATGVAPAQGTDIFVAKYRKDGTLLWAVRAGSNMDDAGQGITVDAAGNAFVTGAFRALGGFADFPGFNGGNTPTLTSAGGSDLFVAKYDPSGQCLWAVADGGAGDDAGAGIAWTPDRVVVVGAWGAGSGPSLTQQAYVREFTGVSSLPTPGVKVLSWSPANSLTQSARARAVAMGSNGRAYLTGVYLGETNFPLAGTLPDAAGNGKMFIVSYAPGLGGGQATHSGHPLAVGAMDGLGIAVSASAVYATGNFYGSATNQGVADFGSGVWTTNAKAVAGGAQLNDFAIVKLGLTLIPQWIRKGGDTGTFADLTSNDETRGLGLDPAGNLYVTGFRHAAAPSPFVNEGATMMAVSYDSAGDMRWTNHATDTGTGAPEDIGLGLAVDAAGDVHVTGEFNEVLQFPNSLPPTLSQTSSSIPATARDMFVAKMNPACCESSRNLVRNGSFEADQISLNTSSTAAVTAWTGTNANNNSVNVELWNGTFNTGTTEQMSPQHLQQHMEINGAGSGQTVSQTITGLDTTLPVTFSFWYVGRPGYDGAFSYQLDGSGLVGPGIVAPIYTSGASWQQRTQTFLPVSSTVTIRFRGNSTQAAGAHIDNVSLVQDCADTDNDGDGIPNLWELQNRLNPNDPADAQQDNDGDGVSNGSEYTHGTDPNDPNSLLALKPGQLGANGWAMTFDAVAGHSYTIECSPTLTGPWTPVVNVPVQSANQTVNVILPVTNQPRSFYRIHTP